MAGLAGAGAGDHHDVSTEAAAAGGGRMKEAAVPAVHGESTCGDTPPLSVSINVPDSRSGLHPGRMPRTRDAGAAPPSETPLSEVQQPQLHSQPSWVLRSGGEVPAMPRSDSTRERDRRFDQFKTFSGRLERQLSTLRGVPQDPPAPHVDDGSSSTNSDDDDVPTADRYFAALEGPELDTLRVSTT